MPLDGIKLDRLLDMLSSLDDRLSRMESGESRADAVNWDESAHPRGPDGKFTSGSGGSLANKAKAAYKATLGNGKPAVQGLAKHMIMSGEYSAKDIKAVIEEVSGEKGYNLNAVVKKLEAAGKSPPPMPAESKKEDDLNHFTEEELKLTPSESEPQHEPEKDEPPIPFPENANFTVTNLAETYNLYGPEDYLATYSGHPFADPVTQDYHEKLMALAKATLDKNKSPVKVESHLSSLTQEDWDNFFKDHNLVKQGVGDLKMKEIKAALALPTLEEQQVALGQVSPINNAYISTHTDINSILEQAQYDLHEKMIAKGSPDEPVTSAIPGPPTDLSYSDVKHSANAAHHLALNDSLTVDQKIEALTGMKGLDYKLDEYIDDLVGTLNEQSQNKSATNGPPKVPSGLTGHDQWVAGQALSFVKDPNTDDNQKLEYLDQVLGYEITGATPYLIELKEHIEKQLAEASASSGAPEKNPSNPFASGSPAANDTPLDQTSPKGDGIFGVDLPDQPTISQQGLVNKLKGMSKENAKDFLAGKLNTWENTFNIEYAKKLLAALETPNQSGSIELPPAPSHFTGKNKDTAQEAFNIANSTDPLKTKIEDLVYMHETAKTQEVEDYVEQLLNHLNEKKTAGATATNPTPAPKTTPAVPKAKLSPNTVAGYNISKPLWDGALEKNKPAIEAKDTELQKALSHDTLEAQVAAVDALTPIANPTGMAQKTFNDHIAKVKADYGVGEAKPTPTANLPIGVSPKLENAVYHAAKAAPHKYIEKVTKHEGVGDAEFKAKLVADTKKIPGDHYAKVTAAYGNSTDAMTQAVDQAMDQYAKATLHTHTAEQLKAIEAYRNSAYGSINASLMKKNPGDVLKTNSNAALIQQALLNSFVPADTPVYRGVSAPFKELTGFNDPQEAVGRAFEHKNFASVSRSIHTSKSFGDNTLLHFTVPAGTPGIVMNGQAGGEREILLGARSMFKVDKVEQQFVGSKLKHIVHCTYLGIRQDD